MTDRTDLSSSRWLLFVHVRFEMPQFQPAPTGTSLAMGDDTRMADYPVIGDVSETLRFVLNAGLSTLVPPPTVEIHDLQGAVPTAPAHVTICLYDVIEDPSAKNRARQKRPGPAGTFRIDKPPMALLLRYL